MESGLRRALLFAWLFLAVCCFVESFRIENRAVNAAPRCGGLSAPLQRLFAAPVVKDPAAIRGASAIELTGVNFELSDAVRDYVDRKLGTVLRKLGKLVRRVEVHLKISKYPAAQHHTHIVKKGLAEAAVTVHVDGQPIIRATGQTDDMYSSILVATHRVARALRQRKERIKHMRLLRKSADLLPEDVDDAAAYLSAVTEMDADEQPEQELADAVQMQHVPFNVSRVKTFDLPPISVDDALAALEAIGHDFYIFNNSATNLTTVLYKRRDGSVGMIQPKQGG